MADGRKQQSEKSMAAILLAARQHFSEKGYEGARVDAIAQAAGVNKATLYYHFGDKSILYKKVLLDVIGRVADNIAEEVKKEESLEAKLRRMISIFATTVENNRPFAPMMLREIASGGVHLPKEVMAQMARIFEVLGHILQEGVLNGEFRPMNPFVVHMQIIGGILFFVASEPARRRLTTLFQEAGPETIDTLQDASAQEAAGYLAENLLNGLRK